MKRWLVMVLCTALTVTSCASSRSTAATGPTVSPLVSDADQWTYSESLEVQAPADLPHPPLPACAALPQAPGWVARENARAGDPSWRPSRVQGVPRVPLYLDTQSTVCGAPVSVHLGGAGGSRVTVRAYRVGWYSGAGARLVWTSNPVSVPPAPGPGRSGETMPSPDWTTTVTLPVDRGWTPGEYLVESWDSAGVAGVAVLVVRDDVDRSGLLVVHSSLTWAAYSQYGSTSLYKGGDGMSDTRALSAALQRPITGSGLASLMFADVPLAQFLEEHGFAARHILDTDLDAWPSMATSASSLVLAGHSEYWTRRMYDAAVAARNAGVNLADLGGNELYWHARLGRSASGTPQVLEVARTLAQDPLAAANPSDATVRWAEAPLKRDGSALIGQRYSALRARGSLQVWSLPAWLGRGTGLRPGGILRGVVANEADGVHPGSRSTPPDLQAVLLGVLAHRGVPDVLVSTTYYSAASGAAVFAAGTTYWTCDLLNACPDHTAPRSTQDVVRAMTLNVLHGFATPRFGSTHPSVRALPADVAAARAALAPAAFGVYGG